MGSGSSAARSLSNEEAAALKSAVTEAPSLQQKLERLQAEAAEVAILRQKLQELEDAQKSSGGESSQPSDSQGREELPKGTKASEAASSYKAEKGADAPHEAPQAAAEDAAALEADKAAAASCRDIHHAALDGNVAAVRHFLREEPSCIEDSGLNSWRPLHRAAEFGHVAVVQHEGADLEETGGDFGDTPLHRAAIRGHHRVVERLLGAGVAVDAADDDSDTPLHRAVAGGHLSVVERLLRAGAAVDAANNDGQTPLHDAALNGHLPVLERLLRAGAAVDAARDDGETPLHVAALNGHLSVVETLLRAGAAVDAARDDGGTPLHQAARWGHLAVVERLLRAGAAVDAADNRGETPLHVAALNGHLSVVETLLRAGAAVDAADNDGQTPLHDAALNGHLPVLERLLRAGAAVDAARDDGGTPLHDAALNGHLSVVETLLGAGAVVDAGDNEGQKPYDLAKEKGDRQVMGALDPVFVALLSGRDCRCSSFSERTLSDLKDEAEQKLAVVIKSLIGPDHQPLDEKKNLEELEIEGGFTLTAVVEVHPSEDEVEALLEDKGVGSAEPGDQGMLQDPAAFINFLISAEIRLVRLEFLLELHERGESLPRRQEAQSMQTKSGETALVEVHDYKRLHVNENSGHVSIAGLEGMTTISFRSVSHMWESMQHPDPWGFQLDLLSRKYQSLAEQGSTWIFLDFMSLHQYRRTQSEDQIFKKGLEQMHVLYSHELVTVDIIKDLTPESWKSDRLVPVYQESTDSIAATHIADLKLNSAPHCQRGWCQAEQEWARLRNMLQGLALPTPPELFEQQVEKLKFTHRSTDAPLVIELQRQVFCEKVRVTTHLHLEKLTAEDLKALHVALPHYTALRYIVANGNALTGADAVALIEAGAIDIQLDSCQLTDDDAVAISESLIRAETVTSVSLCSNCITQKGQDALGKAMQQRPDLKILM